MDIELRDVTKQDLDALFEHQLDQDAVRMAAFPSRTRDAFDTHWEKILGDDALAKKAIVVDGVVAGNIGAWNQDGMRLIGYWIGKEFWGKGVATKGLAEFLRIERTRPLHAFVAAHNLGSIKVLERCGFTRLASETNGDVEELFYELT